MEKCLRELRGHSGSKVYLIEKDNSSYFVRKVGNVVRNYERLTELSGVLAVPEILSYNGEVLEMKYIRGMDMRNYLKYHSTTPLISFLEETFDILQSPRYHFNIKDYSSTYDKMLSWVQNAPDIPFNKEDIIPKLEEELPCTLYHGDMTLENIIWDGRKFWWIDPVTVDYDSSTFDAAKLRQDLECQWFLRNDPLPIEGKLRNIQEQVFKWFPRNDYYLILMLLRVYLHCSKDSVEYNLVTKEIRRLWK